MKDAKEISLAVAQEIADTLGRIDPKQTDGMLDAILGAKRIFVAGAGRSLLMMRGLAMRLMHMGFDSFVVGETVTPAISPEDILLIGSGSGETGTLTVMAQKAKKVGAMLGLFTIYPDSTIGKLADCVVRIDAATTKGERESRQSIQPGANTFEQCLLLIGDSLVIQAISKRSITEENKELMKRHANLE